MHIAGGSRPKLLPRLRRSRPLEASDREDPSENGSRTTRSARLGHRTEPSSKLASTPTGWSWCRQQSGRILLEGAIRWLNYTVESELLMNEIADATTRISTLVGAAKQYSQMDRAPFQTIDVHELLDSTLIMLSGKIGDITVVKEYDRSLPTHSCVCSANSIRCGPI